MAQPPNQDEFNNDLPVITPESRVPDNSSPVVQCSAPVGSKAPTRSTGVHLDPKAKKRDWSATIAATPPGVSPPFSDAPDAPMRSANGHSDLGTIPTTVQPAPPGTPPSASNQPSKQHSPQGRDRGSADLDPITFEGGPSENAKIRNNRIKTQATMPLLSTATKPQTQFSLARSSDEISGGSLPADGTFNGTLTRSDRLTENQSEGTLINAAKKASDTMKFLWTLRGLQVGSDAWMKKFMLQEKTLFENNTFNIHVMENGTRYKIDLGDFKDVYKFKNKYGLKMKVPDNLGWETITDYVPPETELGINYSNSEVGNQLDTTTVGEHVDQFKIPAKQRKRVRNSITLEFSGTLLGQSFTVPLFVTENSMVHELEDALEQELKKIMKLQLDDIVKKKKERLEKLIREMPQYTKFLIMSQERSFTDVHFDFSGSSVYYHVFKGQKIFFIAPPTPANLEIFKEHQKKDHKTWLGKTLSDQWRRIEINEGETALIPGGYLHFVYTPVDSLVIGGNFLMKKYAELQFQCTEHEENILPRRGEINTSHLFEGFRNVMWAYLEYCLLPRLKESNNEESIALGKVFAEGCKPEARCLEKHIWYTKKQKKDLHDELKAILSNVDSDQPSTSAATDTKTKAQAKQKPIEIHEKETVETAGALEEASKSTALDSKKSQKTPSKRARKMFMEESLEDTEGTGLQDSDKPKSSSTSLPSAAPVSRNSKRKRSAPPRTANPSTSAAAKPRRKMNEMMDPMEDDQEELETTSQKPSTSSCPAPAPITRGKKRGKTPTHSNTAASTSAVRQQPKDGSTKQPDSQANMEDSQPQSEIALNSDEKESGPVEKQMDNTSHSAPVCIPKKMKTPSDSSISALTSTSTRQNRGDPSTSPDLDKKESCPVEKQTEAVQKENTEVFQDEEELNHSVSSAKVPYYSNEDDYDTVSHGQQPMDTDPMDNRMEVDKGENGEISEGKKKSTPVHPFSLSGVPTLTHKNEDDAESRPLEKPASIADPVLLAYADSSESANEEDQPTLAAADSKKEGSIPAEDQENMDQTKKDESLGEQKEIAPEHEPIQQPCSGITPFETSALNRRSVPQQDETEATKTPTIEEVQLSSVVLENQIPKPNEQEMTKVPVVQKKILEEPDNDLIEKIQEVQGKMVKEQERIPSNEIVQPVSSSIMKSASQRHSATQTDLLDAPNVEAIEEDKLSSAVSDSEKKKSELIEELLGEVPNVQEKNLEEQERTPHDDSTNPAPSSKTTSNSENTIVGYTLNSHPMTHGDEMDALNVLETDGSKLSPSDSNLKTTGLEPAEDSIKVAQNVQEDMLESQPSTLSNENTLPSSSLSKVPEMLAAASKTPANLPPVSATDHLAQKQSMPSSPELVPQREISDIALLPKNQPSQTRELVVAQNTSLLKTKRQELSAIVMQDLNDTQLMQMAKLLHSLPATQDLQKMDDIAEPGQMVSDNEKAASDSAGKDEDQVEKEKTTAANNNEVMEIETEEGEKQPTGSMASDPARKKEDLVGQKEVFAPRNNDVALLKNALYHNTVLHMKIASLPSTEQEDVCQMVSILLTAVGKFAEISPLSTVTSVADVLVQHHVLINGVDSLSEPERAMAYEILANQMAIAEKYVENKQKNPRRAEKEFRENGKKRSVVANSSTDEPAMKKMKLQDDCPGSLV